MSRTLPAHAAVPSLRVAGLAVALGAALLVPSCGPREASGPAPAPTPAADEVLIGHYGSMTGSEATFGRSSDQGIQLAVAERNAAGGVKGKKVRVKTYDTQGKTQEAGTAVTRLVTDDKVVALLGEVASSLSIAGGRVAQQYGVPMISPSSTNPAVTQVGDMVFRVCFLDSFQGQAMAQFAAGTLKAKKVAVLYDQGQAYSKGLKDYFAAAFATLGGTITTEQAYTGGDQDFSAQLTTIRGTRPDAVFVPGYYTDAGNIALQARKLGIAAPLLGGDGWDSSKLAEIGGAAIEGSYFSNHYSHEDPRPEVQSFLAAYKKAYGGTPDAMVALAYDAARLLFDAMDRAPSLSGKDLAAAIAATQGFPGVTGKITLNASRDATKPAVIVKMKGGVPTFVETIPPAGM